MDLVALELPTGHLAYSLISKMIHQSPDQRPSITEVCEALADRRIERDRKISIVNRKFLKSFNISG